MRKILLLGYVLTILATQNTNCQDPNIPKPIVSISSPNAAALGKYANIPVNYHIGVPDISFPIYTVHEGPLQLPISLSYHASGLKVMEQSSWVGAGFSLNCTGVITRTVKGMPDERVSSETVPAMSYLKAHGYYNYLYSDFSSGSDKVLDYLNFGRNKKDGEADLFFFNFNGFTGTFYIKPDGTPLFFPQQDIKVEPQFDVNDIQYLIGWVITTPDGTKYIFGKTPQNSSDVDAVEENRTNSFENGLDYSGFNVISSWYLNEVRSADNLFSIRLNYAKENYSYYTVSMFPVRNGTLGGFGLVKNNVLGIRLSSIVFSNGTVTFVPASEPRQDLSDALNDLNDHENGFSDIEHSARALKEIQISGGTFCKKFSFEYDYFNSDKPLGSTYGGSPGGGVESDYNIHTDKKRLKLKSFQEHACSETVNPSESIKQSEQIPAYTFEYYNEDLVPRTLSTGQDHWGFYNGADGNTQLIPSCSLDGGATYSGSSANRESSWPQMCAGALMRVTYPTGGSAKFIYGRHRTRVTEAVESALHLPYDISARGNSVETSSSTKYNISVYKTTRYLIRVRAFGSANGGVFRGAYLGTTSWAATSFDWVEFKISLQPGIYEWYCYSSGGDSGTGVQAELYEISTSMGQVDATVGGLRIESIQYNDGNSAGVTVKRFEYSSDIGAGRGVLIGRPLYIMLAKNDQVKASGIAYGFNSGGAIDARESDGCMKIDEAKKSFYCSPSSVLPMQSTQGSHIGYGEVQVKEGDGGYTIYRYKVPSPAISSLAGTIINQSDCDQSAPNYPPAPNQYDYSRGELLHKYIYNASGNVLQENHYRTDYTPGLVGLNGLIVRGHEEFLLATEYKLIPYKKTKVSDFEIVYNQDATHKSTQRVTETFFESANHTLPTRTVVTDIAGGSDLDNMIRGKVLTEVRNTYVADAAIPNCMVANTHDDPWLSMQEGLAYSSYGTALNNCNDATCKLRAWWTYTNTINELRKQYVSSRIDLNTQKANCLSSSLTTAGSELKAVLSLQLRNQVGSLLETSSWRDGNFLRSSRMIYQDQGNNQIYPSALQTILYASPQAATVFTPITFGNTAITADTHYGVEESYKYANGNVVEITGKNGIITSYIWGYNNTLPVIKAMGVPYSVLYAAYSASGGDISALRNQPSLKKMQVFTYGYDPLVGMTSQIDPNGISSIYIYDKLGRLAHIKDKDSKVVRKFEYNYKTN